MSDIDPSLLSASNWIGPHHVRLAALRNAALVIKVGGSIQDNPAQMREVMGDVAALASLGARPVVVHGGGKAINAAMAAAGLEARFVQGQRYTDPRTLEIVEEVLVNGVNRELAGYLTEQGAKPSPLHSLGTCVLFAQRQGTDAAPGKPSEDLGLVGRVTRVNTAVLGGLLASGFVPVIAPVAIDAASRGKFNVNADLAAGAVARALGAGAFILVSDTPGVRTHPDNPDSYATALSKSDTQTLSAKGVVSGGMMPKLHACFAGLEGGAGSVCIIDGRVKRSLLAAALAAPGEAIHGTWIVN